MNILVLNCGSSSIKYQFLDMCNNAELKAKGIIERIGLKDGIVKHKRFDDVKHQLITDVPNHEVGINIILAILTNPEYGVIKTIDEIKAVGHRVAHGGENFTKSVLINQAVKDDIEKCIDLAPLHNPANLKGILAMEKLIPNVPQVAVFDTSFHQTMPPEAYIYALPYEYYDKYKLRRYGFHGTSHKYVAQRASQFIGKKYEDLKIITAHLGNGASMCAIKNGESVDTSMGLTPIEGLVMGTRSGDAGLGVVLYMMEKENLSLKAMSDIVNKKSGLLGISGLTSDMRDLRKARDEGNEKAKLAIDIFVYRIRKYIGSYTYVLGGADMIVFTGGIGENEELIRKMVCENLEFAGIELDLALNNSAKGEPTIISSPNSKTKVVVMPTNEELVIACDTNKIVSKNNCF
ncbi:MAG TPA: acetate kinase [Bacteroidales bacterium]|nr:MAG: acetate kinase [Bacteroidetes bacterium GWF2_33_38]OFY73277.1 MAG: acetate kinase [Bacteroidetes bacterium RIFOXYA12_FULL_33_9]OFY90982.1 MAG: acetate kinase [Bacteroidetes bacterium RIFOXYA2_FULL_33_7]HBF89198.1 acetate kinase [Bacteroidales bacterium]